jgi:chaperonin GroEL
VDKENTTIVEGNGKSSEIQGRVNQIRRQIEETTSRLRPREAAGTPGQARRWRGRHQCRRRDRNRDEGKESPRGRRAARDPRGGRRRHRPWRWRGALIRCLAAIEAVKGANEDERIGVDIVKRAVEFPTRAWQQRRRGRLVIVQEVKRRKGNDGYNVATGVYEDLVKAGVVDPKKVTRTALQNAASIAGPAADHRMPHHRDSGEGQAAFWSRGTAAAAWRSRFESDFMALRLVKFAFNHYNIGKCRSNLMIKVCGTQSGIFP